MQCYQEEGDDREKDVALGLVDLHPPTELPDGASGLLTRSKQRRMQLDQPGRREALLADAFEKALQDPRWAEFAENEKLTTEFDRGQSLDEFWISTGKKIISISEKIENNQ